MYIWQLLFIVILTTLLILYIPELFPRCACCRRLKPRFLFNIHKLTGISPGYRGNTSVCKKCSRQYDIDSIHTLNDVNRIKRTLKARMRGNL